MAEHGEHSSLLQALQRLRSTLLSRLFRLRIDAYHHEGPATTAYDMSERLTQELDKIVHSQGVPTAELQCERPARHTAIPSTDSEDEKAKGGLRRSFAELSRYFRTRRRHPTLNAHVAESLRESTWEHLHTALRLARDGDLCGAKLHAEIANNALKEAARHMSADDYRDFKVRIDEQLSALAQ